MKEASKLSEWSIERVKNRSKERKRPETSQTDLWKQTKSGRLTNRSLKTDGGEEGQKLTKGSNETVRKRGKRKGKQRP